MRCIQVAVTFLRYSISRYSKLDLLYLNAGVLLSNGINWYQGFKNLLLKPHKIFTEVNASLNQLTGVRSGADDRLEMVFASNVFGHYLMVHGRFLHLIFKLRELEHMMIPSSIARVVWTSSQTATKEFFDWNDFQGFKRFL